MRIQHTPGPWTYERDDGEDGTIYFAIHGKGYAFITNVEESEADARLIHAAPELASTLKELLDVLAGRPGMFDLPQYRAGRAILEKAGVS